MQNRQQLVYSFKLPHANDLHILSKTLSQFHKRTMQHSCPNRLDSTFASLCFAQLISKLFAGKTAWSAGLRIKTLLVTIRNENK
jgi:hypothetical protein